MNKEKFITLRAHHNVDVLYHISTMMITCVTDYPDKRTIYTVGHQIFNVKETAEEIMNLIEKAETYTIKTK